MSECEFEVGYTPSNLRCVLRALGWTQRQCAEELGVHTSTVQKWCMAVNIPSHTDMPTDKWQQLYAMASKQTA